MRRNGKDENKKRLEIRCQYVLVECWSTQVIRSTWDRSQTWTVHEEDCRKWQNVYPSYWGDCATVK